MQPAQIIHLKNCLPRKGSKNSLFFGASKVAVTILNDILATRINYKFKGYIFLGLRNLQNGLILYPSSIAGFITLLRDAWFISSAKLWDLSADWLIQSPNLFYNIINKDLFLYQSRVSAQNLFLKLICSTVSLVSPNYYLSAYWICSNNRF